MEFGKNLTVEEMAEYLNIGRKTAYELVNSKGFPSFRIGKRILVNVEKLNEWIYASIEKRWERD